MGSGGSFRPSKRGSARVQTGFCSIRTLWVLRHILTPSTCCSRRSSSTIRRACRGKTIGSSLPRLLIECLQTDWAGVQETPGEGTRGLCAGRGATSRWRASVLRSPDEGSDGANRDVQVGGEPSVLYLRFPRTPEGSPGGPSMRFAAERGARPHPTSGGGDSEFGQPLQYGRDIDPLGHVVRPTDCVAPACHGHDDQRVLPEVRAT